MDAVLELVADHGYARASVGEIERQAGLAPRSGALPALQGQGRPSFAPRSSATPAPSTGSSSVIAMLPARRPAPLELTLLARWNLSSLERRSRLARLVRHRERPPPPDLLQQLYDRLVAQPYGTDRRLAARALPKPQAATCRTSRHRGRADGADVPRTDPCARCSGASSTRWMTSASSRLMTLRARCGGAARIDLTRRPVTARHARRLQPKPTVGRLLDRAVVQRDEELAVA